MKKTLIDVYTDAGWRKYNEKPIYIAHVVDTPDGEIVNHKRLNETAYSSTYIEYYGLLYAMEYCLRVGLYDIHLINDNQTMVYQVQGKYRVKSKQLKPLHEAVTYLWEKLVSSGGVVKITWIKRDLNIADQYVKECKNEEKEAT